MHGQPVSLALNSGWKGSIIVPCFAFRPRAMASLSCVRVRVPTVSNNSLTAGGFQSHCISAGAQCHAGKVLDAK